jgi:glutamate---cysteine ligase / carboxylate-amine ligase
VHCLAHHHAERAVAEASPPEVIEEGLFRAARFGTAAQLPDPRGALRPLSEVLEQTLDACAESAAELGCTDGLQALRALAGAGGGAGRQREIYAVAGMESLLRALVELTADSAAPAPTDR